MKFVFCAPCGNARDHKILDNGNYQCLVCNRVRPPLTQQNPNIRININPELEKISHNLPAAKHLDEVNLQEERRKRGRPKTK